MAFITDDFLLENEYAKTLFHKYAKKMPIVDYHCHIPPMEIAKDVKFENITKVWLGGDHYKWRLMRSDGIDEKYITGDGADKDKFFAFAGALPKAIGNPMVHWCHLELSRYFGYDGFLCADTAQEVWDTANKKLENMTAKSIVASSNVAMIGTTDDPTDSLEWHKEIAKDKNFKTKVLPSFRPDKAIAIDKAGFAEYIAKLAKTVGKEIKTVDDVKDALAKRLEFFCSVGCKAADEGLDYVPFAVGTKEEIHEAFCKVMAGKPITKYEADIYKTDILIFMGREYAKRNIVMQIHYGVIRNASKRRFDTLGPDTGFDCMSSDDCGRNLGSLLDMLDREDMLPKTVLYSLNPKDNAMLGSLIGCFQSGSVKGKVQHGSAWWFNDTKTGMEDQLRSFANLSVLGNFIGMLTDSRSFLSYTRHEYFRRILCNVIGKWVENGEYPWDEKYLGAMVEDICYNNAAKYFGLI